MDIDVVRLREAMERQRMSQTELARAANLSRGRLSTLLNSESPGVHVATARRLAASLGLPENALDKSGVEKAYLNAVAEQHRTIAFGGLGVVATAEPVPMDRGFAPLRVRERPERDRQADPILYGEDTTRALSRPRPFSLGAALARAHRLFMLGDPGAGKTTALRHLARTYASGRQKDAGYPEDPLIPVYVRLADWAERLHVDPSTDPIAAAVAELADLDSGPTSEWLHKQAEAGKVLLLLDGLDEVPDPDRRSLVIEAMRSFIAEHREVQVVVTARIVGFDGPNLGARFDTLTVEPLSVAAVREFATEWCAFRHGHTASRQCVECGKRLERLRHAIVDHPRIRTLAGNPMMLTILLLLHEAGAALPQRRWELYQKIAEAFLFTWQENKRTAVAGAPDQTLVLDDREIVWFLQSLALEMQLRDWTLVPRWWLSEHAAQFLTREFGMNRDKARADADALVWSLQERASLLVERGPERYGFSHLAFQDYFAARAILAADDPIDALRPYFYHPRWREVVRLVAAELDRRQVPRLLRMILDDPDPTGRFLRRGLLLVLGCLADGAVLRDDEVLSELEPEVGDLGKTQWLGIPIEAIELLGDLRSTRLEGFAQRTVDEVLETASSSLAPIDNLTLLMRANRHGLGPQPDEQEDAEEDTPDEDPERPVIEVRFEDRGVSLTIARHPSTFEPEWARAVLTQLRRGDTVPVRAQCAEELGRFSRGRPTVQRGLLRALAREDAPEVRAFIVEALAPAATAREVRRAVIARLESDDHASVRASCADALRSLAGHVPAIRSKLVSLLCSQEAAAVRAGAAHGLSRCVKRCTEVRDLLLSRMNDEREHEDVRVACLRALEGVLPTILDAVETLTRFVSLSSADKMKRVAAQILAEYAASGKVAWSELTIERIEQVLIGLEEPCPHALDALRGLVDAREVRRLGVRREDRIERALADCGDRIRATFIFGSSARGEQGAESDIDLMVIGDVTLKDLTPGLKKAEQELGRQINVAVYSPADWVRRCRERNPFVTRILKDKKEFVIGGQDELAAMAGEFVDQAD